MKKTNKQIVTKKDIETLKNMILATVLATGQQERVIAMPDELRKMCYTDEEITQIKKDADKTMLEMWEKFYYTFDKLGCEI